MAGGGWRARPIEPLPNIRSPYDYLRVLQAPRSLFWTDARATEGEGRAFLVMNGWIVAA